MAAREMPPSFQGDHSFDISLDGPSRKPVLHKLDAYPLAGAWGGPAKLPPPPAPKPKLRICRPLKAKQARSELKRNVEEMTQTLLQQHKEKLALPTLEKLEASIQRLEAFMGQPAQQQKLRKIIEAETISGVTRASLRIIDLLMTDESGTSLQRQLPIARMTASLHSFSPQSVPQEHVQRARKILAQVPRDTSGCYAEPLVDFCRAALDHLGALATIEASTDLQAILKLSREDLPAQPISEAGPAERMVDADVLELQREAQGLELHKL
eukprot:TRINITY_DN35037_c0_g1_i2.p1 TRINITY_DN35037_c0_g1~~TRINITY_DN35037_c0_g1_i2.p1  ORF type:complete len:305 (+),score=67.06 TRINITY_DN35037_c0_g1_i2:114-917(+)